MENSIFKQLGLETFIALDIETTGLDQNLDKIIEISAVKFENGNEIGTFSKLVNPQRKIPKFIEDLTGINNSDIINKPIFSEVVDEFLAFVDSNPIVGHNVGFDLSFINNEAKSSILDIKQMYICDTYYLSLSLLYYLESFKLESICVKLNIDITESHRALSDARNSGLLFLKLINDNLLLLDLNTIYMFVKSIGDSKLFNSLLFNRIFELQKNSNSRKQKKIYLKNNLYKFKSNSYKGVDNPSQVLGSGGILLEKFDKYKYRKNQELFSQNCFDAIQKNNILISEAGTGLGKSFGYLVSSMIQAENNNIIISTSTHNLQSQLLHKDIPVIAELLDRDIKALVIKGKNNYLCYPKLLDVVESADQLIDNEERLQLITLLLWANETLSGDITECNSFNIRRNKKIWDLIKFDKNTCYKHSNNQSKCFYLDIIDDSKSSNVFIVNHALLASNIDNQELLFKKPPIFIIDEAHKLVDNFRNQLTNSISFFDFKKDYDLIKKIVNNVFENKDMHGELLDIYNNFENAGLELIDCMNNFSIQFSKSKILNKNITNYNQVFDIRYSNILSDQSFDISELERIYLLIDTVTENINKLKEQMVLICSEEVSSSQSIQISNICTRFKKYKLILKQELFSGSPDYITWIKVYLKDSQVKYSVFHSAPYTVNKIMSKIIDNCHSLIFCSATLAIDGDYSFFAQESGLDSIMTDKNLSFKSFASPFFYNDQIKLFLYNSHEDIVSNNFIIKISKLILDFRKKINKRILILCTSFKQINDFKNNFKNYNESNILYQSTTSSRENLLKQYIDNDNSILFGTNSFWEGIDLPNDLLELLLILKVPFENPNNPIVSAKIDFFEQIGQDAFYEYQIPQAILKLKQGIGRLIRSDEDLGVCIITDPRLVNKKYGKDIIDSLPSEAHITSDDNLIVNKAETFLKV